MRHDTDVEHSLVYPDGRADIPSGVIPLVDGKDGTYLVRNHQQKSAFGYKIQHDMPARYGRLVADLSG